MSKPRPVHSAPNIRSIPDEAEPSYSFEYELTLSRDRVDDVEDEFHRRLAGPSSGTRRGANGSSSVASGGGGVGVGSGSVTGGGGAGSFWRTDTSGWHQGPSFSSATLKPITINERKSSGGLLGAALQLHSQSDGHSMNKDGGDNRSSIGSSSAGIPKVVPISSESNGGGSVRMNFIISNFESWSFGGGASDWSFCVL
jgi:hypothetical protein